MRSTEEPPKRQLSASGDGPRIDAEKEDEMYPFLIMSPGAIQEFWLFLHSGSTDRAAALASRPEAFDEASRQRLLWEINQFERLLVAFWDNARFSFGTHGLSEAEWFRQVVRGSPLDEVGVALLSECLVRQKRFWEGKRAAGGADVDEAAVRLGVIAAAHELFHERLGLSREAVERRCEDLWAAGPLWENGRASYEDLQYEGAIVVPADESPITQDELKSRLDAVRQRAEAARAGGSHEHR